jgi:cysteine synthase
MKIANTVTDLIGNTPMLRIRKLSPPKSARILVKLEEANIGGSVKDRMAKYLIEYAEAAGLLKNDKTILEATSGNTGIALAMIAASKGYRMALTMPESVSIERRKIIKAYGADLILTSSEKGTAGAIEHKQKLLADNPDKYTDINQFEDPANILAHYHTTGPEIIEQTGGNIDVVVVGIGTAGTGVGLSQYLKQCNPDIRVIGVTPAIGFPVQGLRNPGENYPTKLYRSANFDEVVEISHKDKAGYYNTAHRAAREEGLLLGISSAAILHVALQKASVFGEDHTLVAVLPDSGLKYLSTDLYEE